MFPRMTHNIRPVVQGQTEMDLEGIWQSFSRDLRGYLQRKVPAQDAEDLLQEIFLALIRNPTPEGVAVSAWIWTLLRNHVANFYRKRGVVFESLEPDSFESKAGEVTPAEAWVATWLEGFAEELPKHYSEALILADFQGFTMRDVADKLGLSVSGAKSRVQRARLKIAEALKACCAFYFDEQGRIEGWEKRHSGSCECGTCESQS